MELKQKYVIISIILYFFISFKIVMNLEYGYEVLLEINNTFDDLLMR